MNDAQKESNHKRLRIFMNKLLGIKTDSEIVKMSAEAFPSTSIDKEKVENFRWCVNNGIYTPDIPQPKNPISEIVMDGDKKKTLEPEKVEV